MPSYMISNYIEIESRSIEICKVGNLIISSIVPTPTWCMNPCLASTSNFVDPAPHYVHLGHRSGTIAQHDTLHRYAPISYGFTNRLVIMNKNWFCFSELDNQQKCTHICMKRSNEM